MKTGRMLTIFISLASVSLLAQEITVKTLDANVNACSKPVEADKTIHFERQNALVIEITLDSLKSCVFNQDGLRKQMIELLFRGLITEEKYKKVLSEVVIPAEQLVPKLQGILREKQTKH